MKTILVVDDEQKIRTVYRRVLRREGFFVLEAATAMEANNIMQQVSVDLLLLDINMPDIDGTILYEIGRTFHPHTKVIVASVHPVSQQKKRINGAADYFDKSEGINILIQKVKTLIGNEFAKPNKEERS